MAAQPNPSDVDPKEDEGAGPGATATAEGPPEEEFWEKYNGRLEFPLGTVASVFLHILVFAVVVFGLFGLMNDEDRTNPPLQLLQVGGLDDFGEGSAGSGGDDADRELNVDPYSGVRETFATPQALADAKAELQKIALDDPTGKTPIAPPNVAAYEKLDKTLREKLLGGRKGSGNQAGKGDDGTAGAGPGGTGADSTRARGLRWVLRFRITGGRDYLDQLRAMGAEILVPLPPDNKKCLIIRDLASPSPATATDADLNRLAGKIQFSDNRAQPVREVLEALRVNPPTAKAFWAFFPKDVEEQLARKEKGYRNRRAEDIEETVFQVTIRGGSFEMVVVDQVIKK